MKISAFKICAFFIWPFWGFVSSAFNFFNSKWDNTLLILFSGFIGLNIAITSEGPDINRYRDDFINYQVYDFEHLYKYISNYIQLKDGYYDIGIQIINYVVSRFTDNYHIYFLTIGLIYGIFYAFILKYLSNYYKNIKPSLILYLLFLCSVFFLFPTQGINQFRFWTASALFITGYLLFSHGQMRGLLLVLLSPLMHIGIGLLIIGLLISFSLRRIKVKFLVYILPLALTLNLGFHEALQPIVEVIGGSAESKFITYTGQMASERLDAHLNRIWYAAYWRSIALFGFALLSLSFYKKLKYASRSTLNLYRLNLIFLFFGLLMQGFYMHFRYYEVFIFLQIIFFVKYLYEGNILQKMNYLKKIALIFIMLIILMIKIPAALQFLMPTALISNFITAWFFFDLQNVSIWHLIGF